jgi:hypothetical protein
LSSGSWAEVAGGNITGGGGEAIFTDSRPALTGNRFYRVRLVP